MSFLGDKQLIRPWTVSVTLVMSLLFLPFSVVQSSDDVSNLSLEELMGISISSASKREQRLADVAAAISVVSKEDLRRRGIDNLPDALRLVPGVHVAQLSSETWAIGTRGFADEYSNKLLVLVDGQSVYTELFSGVFWIVNDVPIDDVEQIEVVRGPGASVWGVNAVNGVINIITKHAAEQENAVSVNLANDSALSVLRGSAQLSDYSDLRFSLSSRIEDGKQGTQVKASSAAFYTEQDANDSDSNWENNQINLRLDREKGKHSQRLVYNLSKVNLTFDSALSGGQQSFNDLQQIRAMGQWSIKVSEQSEVVAQIGYKELSFRWEDIIDGANTSYEGEIRHLFDWRGHELSYGLTYKDWTSDAVGIGGVSPQPAVDFNPNPTQLITHGGFFQNQFLISDDMNITVGARLDNNSFTGEELQASLRFSKALKNKGTLWGALSRAIRTPSRYEYALDVEQQGLQNVQGLGFVPVMFKSKGNKLINSEQADVAEVGYRRVWSDHFSTDMTTFYHQFDDLVVSNVSVQPLPLTRTENFDNGAAADLLGLEWSLDWKFQNYRFGLNGSYSTMNYRLDNNSGTVESASGSYPVLPRWLLGSYFHWNVSDNWDFDIWGNFVDQVDGDNIPFRVGSFGRIDVRIAYIGTPNLLVAFIAQDIGDRGDVEFVSSNPIYRPYSAVKMEPVFKLNIEYQL